MSANEQRQRTTVLIADDHAVVRRGLRMVLDAEEDFEVVAEAGDIAAADAVRARPPARRPGARPQHARRAEPGGDPALPRASPDTAIVVLTMQDDPAFAREALRAGALGYVLKEAADDELVEAVRARRRAART